MDRGLSTVLDVGLACLLVTASATLLVTTPVTPTDPPDADRVGRAILPTTITIHVDGHAVETSIGDTLVAAANDGALSRNVRTAVIARTHAVHRQTSIHARIEDRETGVDVGKEPAADATVDAAVFRIGSSTAQSASLSATEPAAVVIVVRTWSP